MKKLYQLLMIYFFLSLSIVDCSDNLDDVDNSKRKMALNNLPISIFTPQTNQLNQKNLVVQFLTGSTGSSDFCGLSLAMLRRTLKATLATGDTGTFDTGVFYRITSNPTGSPSMVTPAESLTIEVPGYYLIEFSYAGDQPTPPDPANLNFYASFNLLLNNAVLEQFTLSTFGIRQMWHQFVFLHQGDVVSFQAASSVPFLASVPVGITGIDSLIMTIDWIGPCLGIN